MHPRVAAVATERSREEEKTLDHAVRPRVIVVATKWPSQERKPLDQAVRVRVIAVATKRSREETERAVSRRGAGRATRGIQVTRSKARLRLEMRHRGTRKPKDVRRGSLANRALLPCLPATLARRVVCFCLESPRGPGGNSGPATFKPESQRA